MAKIKVQADIFVEGENIKTREDALNQLQNMIDAFNDNQDSDDDTTIEIWLM